MLHPLSSLLRIVCVYRLLSMAYFKYHIFFCTNRREDGTACCTNADAQAMRDFAKQRTKALGIAGREGCVRVNSAGCLNRCGEGPVAVVYPDDVWYRYTDSDDVNEIVEEHLLHGRVVERLKL